MEAVIFDGKEYIKASVLAARFRYTADYLGQLCRAKKVDARLVGRAWYINLDSLNQHRDARYKNVEKTRVTEPKKPSSNYLSRIDVEPILKKKTVSIIKTIGDKNKEIPVKYEADEHALIPRVHKEFVTKNIVIEQADADVVKVKNETPPHTAFRAESLPEVYLSGVLAVDGLTEASTEMSVSDDIASKIKPDLSIHQTTPNPHRTMVSVRMPHKVIQKSEVKVNIHAEKGASVAVTRPVLKKADTPRIPRIGVQPPTGHGNERRTDMVKVASINTPSFKPHLVQEREQRHVKSVQKKQDHEKNGKGLLLPFVSVFLACAISATLLGMKMEITVHDAIYDTQFAFELPKNFWK